MIQNPGLEHCLSFINSQLQSADGSKTCSEAGIRRAVTISRQTGCGAFAIAEKLAQYLQEHLPQSPCPWTVFDRNLIDKVLEDHNLPAYLAKFLPEDRVSKLEDFLGEVLAVRPPARTVVLQTAETILQLAMLGNVILIGRGGNIITAKLPCAFHVRLVAPFEKRVEYAHKQYNMSEGAAHKFCETEDLGRERYLKKYFNADINNPLLYHMIINTAQFDQGTIIKLVGEAVLNLN